MENSRLIKAVKSLNDTEIVHFQKLVNSPFFNKNNDVIRLFKVISDKKGQTQITKKEVFDEMFPKSKYNDLKVRHISSNLLKIIEKYLSLKRFYTDGFTEQFFLLEELNHRNLDKQFKSLQEKLKSSQQKVKFRDQHFYFNQFRLETELGKFIEKHQDRSLEPNLQEIDRSLDIYFIIHKLKLACSIYSYQNIMDIDYNQVFIEDIIEYIGTNGFDSLPAVQIYYNALMTLRDPDESSYFDKLKELLINNVERFPPLEAGDIFVLARNYCIKKVNNGQYDYFQPLYDLYLLDLENGSLIEDGYISPFSYKNIVSVGLKLDDFKGVETFIHEYKDNLDPEFKATMFTYNLAKYHFTMKQYDDVISLLHHAEYNELFVNLDSKVMLLKTFYELDEIDPMYSLIESFRVYLKRKRKLSYHRTNYLNFIRILKKITTTTPHQEKRIAKIRDEIDETPKMIDKEWLLEKLSELA